MGSHVSSITTRPLALVLVNSDLITGRHQFEEPVAKKTTPTAVGFKGEIVIGASELQGEISMGPIKAVIRLIDRLFFGSFASKLNERRKTRVHLTTSLEGAENIAHAGLDSRGAALLDNLADKYGSDKGGASTNRPFPWPPHTYTQVYARLFNHCRENVRNVFECGLGTSNPDLVSSMGERGQPGASLRIWRDYFPNAMIYGADIDTATLFEDERIVTGQMDQTDATSIRKFWDSFPEVFFDLMVDDGLHTFEAGLTLFRNSSHRLSPNGIWAIEDVVAADAARLAREIRDDDWLVDVICLSRLRTDFGDNNLVVMRKA